MLEISVPELPKGTSASLLSIRFNVGDRVEAEDCLFEIETDKVILEVIVPADGVVHEQMVGVGETVTSKQILCLIEADKDTYQEDLAHAEVHLKESIKTQVSNAKSPVPSTLKNPKVSNSSNRIHVTAVFGAIFLTLLLILVFS
jgi:2-oxoglutarate dehydrogenase E2 component (dihydrolipoamide succinyltransferase)